MTRTSLRPMAAALSALTLTGVALGAGAWTAADAAPAAWSGPVAVDGPDPRLAGRAGVDRSTAAERVAQRRAEQLAEKRRIARQRAAERRAAERRAAERRAAERRAAQERAAEAAASRSAARHTGDPRGIAAGMIGDYGWDSGQFDCLDALWQKESGWDPTAANPTSSAYGIPQALPGSKMASAGSDWETNPATQIAWGLGYIDERYGTPCAAWEHSQAVNWY